MPTPIVRDDDAPTPDCSIEIDAARPGIEAVFDQLLDDGRRTLHDLARRNLIGDKGGEPLDSLRYQLGGMISTWPTWIISLTNPFTCRSRTGLTW